MARTVSHETRNRVAIFIKLFERKNGFRPSSTEISKAVGISQPAAIYALKELPWVKELPTRDEIFPQRRKEQPRKGHRLSVSNPELAKLCPTAYAPASDGWHRQIPRQLGLPGFVRVEPVGPTPAVEPRRVQERRAVLAARGMER